MPGDIEEAAQMAVVAAAAGGLARVLIALKNGLRNPWLLLLDFGLGVMLGVIAAGFLVWWDVAMRAHGWPLLIVAAASGGAGAIGTRVLDFAAEYLRRKAEG